MESKSVINVVWLSKSDPGFLNKLTFNLLSDEGISNELIIGIKLGSGWIMPSFSSIMLLLSTGSGSIVINDCKDFLCPLSGLSDDILFFEGVFLKDFKFRFSVDTALFPESWSYISTNVTIKLISIE